MDTLLHFVLNDSPGQASLLEPSCRFLVKFWCEVAQVDTRLGDNTLQLYNRRQHVMSSIESSIQRFLTFAPATVTSLFTFAAKQSSAAAAQLYIKLVKLKPALNAIQSRHVQLLSIFVAHGFTSTTCTSDEPEALLHLLLNLDSGALQSPSLWESLETVFKGTSDDFLRGCVVSLARKLLKHDREELLVVFWGKAFGAQVAGRLLKALATSDSDVASAFLERTVAFLTKQVVADAAEGGSCSSAPPTTLPGPNLSDEAVQSLEQKKALDLLVQCDAASLVKGANAIDLLARGHFAAAVSALFSALSSAAPSAKAAAAQLTLRLLRSGELRQVDAGQAEAAARGALCAWGLTPPEASVEPANQLDVHQAQVRD